MFIRNVDEGLERLIRARLPLPEEVGDVSFDTPSRNWSAQLSRLTVNLFLFHIDRSGHPARAPQQRVDADGRAQRRAPQPMIELGYLVSAWAGSPRDEHLLLGDLVSLLAGVVQLPHEYVGGADSSVHLTLGSGGLLSVREIWQGVGGDLKAGVLLTATAAADTWDWTDEAPAVERISVLAAPSS
jgi:hypothetical protein